MQLSEALKADGRWRLILFADTAQSRLFNACEDLERIKGAMAPNHGIYDVLALFQQPHRELDLRAMPNTLLPAKGKNGLIDYERIFAPALTVEDDIFSKRSIDRQNGAMILVRPDQFVALVLPLDDSRAFSAFLGRIYGRLAAAR